MFDREWPIIGEEGEPCNKLPAAIRFHTDLHYHRMNPQQQSSATRTTMQI